VELDLNVYPPDAVLVQQTQEPALDPLRNGSLSVKPVIIRSKGNGAQATLTFNLPSKDSVPVSFDVALSIGGQTIPCGSLWAVQTSQGETYSGMEQSVDLPLLAAAIKEADIILTPNAKPIEHVPSVDRIWGGQIVFSNVPLKRLDLGSAAQNHSFGPPFVARLPQGSVELLAVATAGKFFPDTNRVRTWRPDGILTTNFNFRPAGNSSLSDIGDTNVIYREVILQSKGLPAGDADMQCQASDPGTQSDWPEAWLNGRPATNIFIGNLQLPVEAKTLHLKIGVAAGPWTRDDLLSIPQSDVGSSDSLFDQGRTNWVACIQSIDEKNGSTKVIAYHTAVAGWQAQLLLVDFAGKEWPLGNGFTLGGLCSISAECRGLKLSQVKEIHFRIRPYHTVEFSNVSLQPGYRTAVAVKDSDEESHAGIRPESAK